MLAKDAARRPAMAEVANRLESIAALSARGRRNLLWIAAAFAVVAPAAFLWLRNAEQRAPQFGAPVAITRYSGIEQQPSFSPDGSRVAFVWSGPDGQQDDIYIRSTEGRTRPRGG